MAVSQHYPLRVSGRFVKSEQWERCRAKWKLYQGYGGFTPRKKIEIVCKMLQYSAFWARKWFTVSSVMRSQTLTMGTAFPVEMTPAPRLVKAYRICINLGNYLWLKWSGQDMPTPCRRPCGCDLSTFNFDRSITFDFCVRQNGAENKYYPMHAEQNRLCGDQGSFQQTSRGSTRPATVPIYLGTIQICRHSRKVYFKKSFFNFGGMAVQPTPPQLTHWRRWLSYSGSVHWPS